MVNPNDLTSFNSLNREEVLQELKPILGAEYCDWNASLLYTITKMANDITHLKTDNQVWYDKAQELDQQIQTKANQQEQTIANLNQTNQTQQTQLQETQELNQKLQQDNQELLKDIHTYKQTIQGLENQFQDSQQRILALEADKSDLIHQLTQAKQKYHHHLHQEKSYLTKEIQLIKEVIYA